MLPPTSQIGTVAPELRQQIIRSSPVYGHYEQLIDRESAYEKLVRRTAKADPALPGMHQTGTAAKAPKAGKPAPSAFDQVLKVANSRIGRQVERELVRGLMGSLLGTSRRK
jgi:hypothetical protein